MALEQVGLMRDLNEAVLRELDGVHYATMVAVGFHARRGLLVMTNAGHPPAFWYRANRREWNWFEPKGAAAAGVRGKISLLGLLPNVSYDRMTIKPQPGDLIVLDSDGVSEATNPAGRELGRRRSHDGGPSAELEFGGNVRCAIGRRYRCISRKRCAGGR